MPIHLTREQVLITLAVTTLILLLVAQVWGWALGLPLVPGWHLDLNALLSGCILGLGLNGLGAALYYLWLPFRTVTDEYLALVLEPLQPWDIFWIGLLPGLSEELLFRGVALTSLGLVGSSLLFGVLHLLDRRYWPYGLWAAVIGLILGFTMVSTGNLLIPVVAHTTNNWLAAGFWYGRKRR
ncbi:CPBP family intramembrane glutamic endopeptidase [Anthocerotibacter panamensis]|uniref:CPBP family intramembrane glutamic endopeptidase n=1 Tax=Anthocerotibacter panamensis TaxID=2857077 RepID=UPI001FDA7E92|nr:CPBP family intramembrane glutamic endopeptidase [Anthocerotibacter panamensis]